MLIVDAFAFTSHKITYWGGRRDHALLGFLSCSGSRLGPDSRLVGGFGTVPRSASEGVNAG